MSDTTGTMISPEAHQRMTTERDQLKSRVAELEAKVVAADKASATFLARTKYLEHRAQADQSVKALVAELDIATPMLDGIPLDQIDTTVQSVYAKLEAFRGGAAQSAPAAAGEASATPAEPVNPPNQNTPAPIPQPNPGAEGTPASAKVLDLKERAELVKKEGIGGVRAAVQSGAIKFDPEVLERRGL